MKRERKRNEEGEVEVPISRAGSECFHFGTFLLLSSSDFFSLSL